MILRACSLQNIGRKSQQARDSQNVTNQIETSMLQNTSETSSKTTESLLMERLSLIDNKTDLKN